MTTDSHVNQLKKYDSSSDSSGWGTWDEPLVPHRLMLPQYKSFSNVLNCRPWGIDSIRRFWERFKAARNNFTETQSNQSLTNQNVKDQANDLNHQRIDTQNSGVITTQQQ